MTDRELRRRAKTALKELGVQTDLGRHFTQCDSGIMLEDLEPVLKRLNRALEPKGLRLYIHLPDRTQFAPILADRGLTPKQLGRAYQLGYIVDNLAEGDGCDPYSAWDRALELKLVTAEEHVAGVADSEA